VAAADKAEEKAQAEVLVAKEQAKEQARKAKRATAKQKARAKKEKKFARRKKVVRTKHKGKSKGKLKVKPNKAVKKLMKKAVQAKKAYSQVKKGINNVRLSKLAPGRRKGKAALQHHATPEDARCVACKARCAHGDGACRGLCYVTQGGGSPCAV